MWQGCLKRGCQDRFYMENCPVENGNKEANGCASRTASRETCKSPKSITQSSRRWRKTERTDEELSINQKQVWKREGEWPMKKLTSVDTQNQQNRRLYVTNATNNVARKPVLELINAFVRSNLQHSHHRTRWTIDEMRIRLFDLLWSSCHRTWTGC